MITAAASGVNCGASSWSSCPDSFSGMLAAPCKPERSAPRKAAPACNSRAPASPASVPTPNGARARCRDQIAPQSRRAQSPAARQDRHRAVLQRYRQVRRTTPRFVLCSTGRSGTETPPCPSWCSGSCTCKSLSGMSCSCCCSSCSCCCPRHRHRCCPRHRHRCCPHHRRRPPGGGGFCCRPGESTGRIPAFKKRARGGPV